jgi:hypothetical protein
MTMIVPPGRSTLLGDHLASGAERKARPGAKVATARPNPREADLTCRVIVVYTLTGRIETKQALT